MPDQIDRARMTFAEKAMFAVFALPIWLSCGWLMLVSVPRAAAFFASLGMRLPYMTEFVFTWGWLTVPAVLLAACVFGSISQRRWSAYVCFVVVPAILAGLVFVSVFTPLREMIAGLPANNIDVWAIIWG